MSLERPALVAGWIEDPVPVAEGLRVVLHATRPLWAVVPEEALPLMRAMDGTRPLAELAALWRTHAAAPSDAEALADVADFAASLARAGMLAPPAPQLPTKPHRPTPPKLTIYPTEECNLRCRHCAVVEGRMPKPELEPEDVRRVIREHLALHPGAEVQFLGGEPLLDPEMPGFLEEAARHTDRVTVGTNGLLLTEDLARRLAAIAPLRVQVSLDGATAASHDRVRGKGTFAKAWAAVERLVAAGMAPRVWIACTLTRHALPEVDTLVAACDRLGIGRLRFLPLLRERAGRTNWDDLCPAPADLAAVIRHLVSTVPDRPGAVTEVAGSFPGYVPDPPEATHWCPIGRTLIVDSLGSAFTCPSMRTAEVTVGNVRRDSVEALASRQEDARAWMERRRDEVAECRVCAWRNFCRGGCIAFMAHQSGDIYVNDMHCELRRTLYRDHVSRVLRGTRAAGGGCDN
jgi:radical SAM protein with 4Fe4S-binding SPASM domain